MEDAKGYVLERMSWTYVKCSICRLMANCLPRLKRAGDCECFMLCASCLDEHDKLKEEGWTLIQRSMNERFGGAGDILRLDEFAYTKPDCVSLEPKNAYPF